MPCPSEHITLSTSVLPIFEANDSGSIRRVAWWPDTGAALWLSCVLDGELDKDDPVVVTYTQVAPAIAKRAAALGKITLPNGLFFGCLLTESRVAKLWRVTLSGVPAGSTSAFASRSGCSSLVAVSGKGNRGGFTFSATCSRRRASNHGRRFGGRTFVG